MLNTEAYTIETKLSRNYEIAKS